MKVTVNELEQCRRGLEVEVPEDRVSEEMERAFREYSQHARVPGFRQGKIPLDVVRRRFAKEVRDEVVERIVREYAHRALEEKNLRPVEAPVLDEVHYEPGQPLTFKATFEVRPQVAVTGYTKPEVRVARREVTEEMIAASLRSLAERAAKLEAVSGRPVQKGDYAVGKLSCRFLRGKGKNLSDEPLMLEAGSEENHPDFNAAILGMNAGESKAFEVAYPEDSPAEALRGSVVAYTVMVREIKKKVVPPVDDDLARELGDFKDLAEIREKVKAELERRAAGAEQAEAKSNILADLVRRYPVAVPETLIEAQVDARLQTIAREMVAQGIDPTKAAVNWSEERDRTRPAATEAVRAGLILEAIAEQEGIEATEEDVNTYIREEARRHEITVAAMKEQLSQNARLTSLRRQIVREKSLDFLLRDAIITPEVK
jgi:trigger factor